MNKHFTRVLATAAMLGTASMLATVLPSDAATPTYTYKCWGTSADHCNVTVQAPKGWKFTKLDKFQARFTNGTSQLRVRAIYSKYSPRSVQAQKLAALKKVPGLKIISQSSGKKPTLVQGNAPTVAYYDITYTYRDTTGAQRLATTRYADQLGDGRAYVELTVGGRPTDKTALTQTLNHATQTVTLVG
ncbi:hypothetical protein GCM10009554_53680 [Kribbella koreensis]|uniref:Uncharacterized protein n=1 Tax=Kribbella koreensis TaxID=57909 RepID=A0ABN1R6T4_9ACTN